MSALFSCVLAGLLGYALGSIPTAFLLVRWKSKLDVRLAGSGNVGMLNSYEVTRSRGVAAAVLAVDALKGVCAVLLAGRLWEGDFGPGASAGIGALAGHNFPALLGFRGGRGLATGAGILVLYGWCVVALWGAVWSAGFLALRRVNPANAIALLVTLLFVQLSPEGFLSSLLAPGIPVGGYRIFCAAAFFLVLVKHIQPVREYISERRKSRKS